MSMQMTGSRPPPEMVLPRRLLHWAETRGSAIALRQKEYGIWQAHDWAEYARMARHFGLGLVALGLTPGEHVAILSESRREWVVAQLGTNLVGGVTVGIYPTSPANEVDYLLTKADVTILVCEDQEQFDKALAIPGESGEFNHAAMRLARYSSSQPAVLRRRRMESLPGALRVRL
jgi:long-chain acyl-CoA synthetase